MPPNPPRRAPPEAAVARMFDEIVDRYDLLNDLLSFGLARSWRRAAARATGARRGALVLDLGCGTGRLGQQLVERARVVGVDISQRMLLRARLVVGRDVSLVRGSAFALPFRDEAFSAAVSAFVLRNLDDLERAFAELARVLAPAATIAVVDVTEPAHPLFRRLFDAYFATAAPVLGRLSPNARAYRYLAGSLSQLPPPAEVCAMLQEAGFEDVSARPLSGGLTTLFRAVREKRAT